MSPKKWKASITLGETVKADGLRLVKDVAASVGETRVGRRMVRSEWPDARVVPTVIGGSPCHRTIPVAKPREFQGEWRGTTETAEGTADALCLRVERGPAELPAAWVTFEFYETEPGWIAIHYVPTGRDGFVHHVCTPDERGAWEHTWVNTSDSHTWQRAVVRLVTPTFRGAGMLGADLRFVSSGPLYLRRVEVSSERPDGWDRCDLNAHARRVEEHLAPRYPRAACPVSAGNIGSGFDEHNRYSARDVAPWLPVYKATGFTSIQSYVMWKFVEGTEGAWDWSFYDWVVALAQRFGLKWVAFIPIGPWYSMPQWWLDSPESRRNRCLEHGEESWVQSVWNPNVLRWVKRFFHEFARHYTEEAIESVMLGPAGDYGETTTNGTFIGKNYHTHVGYWCGEDLAVEDFRRSMEEKYVRIAALNEAWETDIASFSEVRPLLRDDAPSDRMWLDQVAWYVGRMTWWTKEWAEIVREALPNTVVYMAAGGSGDPPHAGRWTDQTRAIRHTGIGARVTNEGGDYAFNFAYTSWQGTCCRFYRTPFGNEPWGGDMAGVGDLGRIYNAVTQEAANLWFYDGHVRPPSGRRALERGLPFLDGRFRRFNRVAVYYPWTYFCVKNEHGFGGEGARDVFWPQVEELRDVIDFDLVDDGLIRDGIMVAYDFLILLQGTVYECDEIGRLVEWVRGGGVLITHNIGIPATVEGDVSAGRELLSFAPSVSKVERTLGARIATVGDGRVVLFPRRADRRGWRGDDRWERDHRDHPATHPGFWTTITGTLRRASELGTGLADYPVIDGKRDDVFGAIMDDRASNKRGVLFLNQSNGDVVKRLHVPGSGSREIVVPAGQIVFAPFDRA